MKDEVYVARDHGKEDRLRRTHGNLANYFEGYPVFRRLILPILRSARVCVWSKANFSYHSFQYGDGIVSVLTDRVAGGPFYCRRLIDDLLNARQRRLCFVLLVGLVIRHGVASFEVPVLCLSTYLHGV